MARAFSAMRRSSFASTIDSAFGDQFGDEHFYRQRMAEPRVLAERLGFESTRKSRRSPVTQDGFRVGPSLHMTPATGGFLAGRSRRALSSSARMFPLIAGRYLPRSIFAKEQRSNQSRNVAFVEAFHCAAFPRESMRLRSYLHDRHLPRISGHEGRTAFHARALDDVAVRTTDHRRMAAPAA